VETDNSTLQAALNYCRRGWMVTPVQHGSKKPLGKAWQNQRLDEEDIRKAFAQRCNVGVLLGQTSGGLVDIDLDVLQAVAVARLLLPVTARFGRPGKPGSHYLYIARGEIKTRKFAAPDHTVLLELRFDGAQTVFPPSIHVSGERIEWEEEQAPAKIEASELERLVTLVAVGSTLARAWPAPGLRHEGALAAAGVLLKSGASAETTRTMMGAIAQAAGDDEVEDRVACVESTVARLKAGQTVSGWNKLKEMLGPSIVTSLRRWLHVAAPEPGVSGLPVIVVNNRQLREVTADARAALEAASQPPSDFAYGDTYVHMLNGNDGRPRLKEIDDRSLRSLLTRAADFSRTHKNGADATFPPRDVVADLLGARQLPFPVLRALVELPILRADGTLTTATGYDPATQRYYAPSFVGELPIVPDSPTSAELKQALDLLLNDALVDFPFVADGSLANTVALLLTPLLPLLIGEPALTPLVLIDAVQQGSGKTWLAHLASVIATGRPAAVMALPEREEELCKMITAALMEGAGFMVFDNIERRIDSEHLARALTSPVWKDRVLRFSRTVEVPNNALWIATGNNLALGGDMARRCIPIRLDPKTSRPWRDRSFHHDDLLGWAVANRAQLVWSLLVLARSWIAAGQPHGRTASLATFDGWASTAGGILRHAGVAGFLTNLEELYAHADEEAARWESFLLAWREALRERPVTTAELHQAINCSVGLAQALPEQFASAFEGPGTKFRVVLGSDLARRVGRRYGADQLYVERSYDGHAKIARWRVRSR